MTFHVPEDNRIQTGHLRSDESFGNNGLFIISYMRAGRSKLRNVELRCIASDGMGWEHVSVSPNRKRAPFWDEMCFIKDKFWDEDDAVIQIHPPRSEYVNFNQYTLHLWRKAGTNDFYTKPDKIMVGPS
jgi:hypothetical protein